MPKPTLRRESKYVFFILILTAGAVRFNDLGIIPFFNDELSAIHRLRFDTFSALISEGVVPDFHPALVQVFLWFWYEITGFDEFAIRLPFAIAGLASLVIIHRIQKESFGLSSANATLAFLAASQLFVFDSVMARPYAFGMLFIAFTALFWHRIVIGSDHGFRSYLGLGLFAALSVYTHYYAGVVAGIIYLSGFLYSKNLRFVPYLMSGAGAVVLFLPQLSIFLDQVSRGGIGGSDGWLGAPDALAFVDFTLTTVNHNSLIFGLTAAALLIALVKLTANPNKLPAVFLLWFLLSYAFGYFYSVHRNPIMHVQTMVFAFPFLFMAATSWLKPSRMAGIIVPLSVVGILTYDLVYERRHYEVMRRQPFAWAGGMTVSHPEAMAGFRLNPEYVRYYNREYSPLSEVYDALQSTEAEGFLSDGSDYTADVLASRRFPHIEKRENGFTFTGFYRTLGTDNREDFGDYLLRDSTVLDSSDEFIALADLDLGTGAFNFAHEVVSYVRFDSLPDGEVHLVFDVQSNEKTIHWSAAKMADSGVDWKGEWYLVHGLLFWNVFGKTSEMDDARLKIYLWNPAKMRTHIGYREVYLRDPNPNRYGLLSARP